MRSGATRFSTIILYAEASQGHPFRAVSFSKDRKAGEIGETKFENREVKNGTSVPRRVA